MSRSKLRVGIRGTLVVLILVFALVSIPQFAVKGQNSGVPQSEDPTVTPLEDELSDAEAEGEFDTLMDEGNLQEIGKTLGMDDPREEWTWRKSEGAAVRQEGNLTKFKLAQVVTAADGSEIRVRNGNLSLSMDENNNVDLSTAHVEYLDDPQPDTTTATLSKARAMLVGRALARQHVNALGGPVRDPRGTPEGAVEIRGARALREDAVLEVHPGFGPGQRKLTWHVRTEDHAVGGPVLLDTWVDQSENVLEFYNNAQTYNLAGIGRTAYDGEEFSPYMTVDYTGGYYVLNDNSLRIGTYDNYQTTGSTYQSSVYGSNIFGNFNQYTNRNTTNADVQVGTVKTLSFMYYVLGRDFVDGARGPRYYSSVTPGVGTLITAKNHYSNCYVNAFWNGTWATFGDGNASAACGGSTSASLTSLDIVSHEWHHGTTQWVAGLNYVNESGALNEAMSDIFGAMTERYWRGQSGHTSCHLAGNCTTWKMGDQVWTPSTAGDALRYMNEPWRAGDPWHYSLRYTGTADNGGVHTNSGIANFAFFELSTGYYGVGGIGASAATQIFWKGLRDCMIPTDGYYWARYCTQWAASSLYGGGSSQYNATVAVWNFVGAPS